MKLSENQIKKHTERYYRDLANYERLNQRTESTTEMAFKSLLKNIGDEIDLILIKPFESLFNDKKIVPDGILTTQFGRYLGYWEAKDTNDDLDKEIYKKLQKGYPRTNTIFEDTKTAVLYQDNSETGRFDLKNEKELIQLLKLFFSYNEPVLEEFKKAVEKFKENIPRLAIALQEKIVIAKSDNIEFQTAITEFLKICSASFHSDIKENDVEDMLIQHLLTERIFRKVFDNPDFVSKNVIAAQLEKMVTLLTQSAFTRNEFFKDIDFFYLTIEQEASKIDSDSEKQSFLNNVYELFFQSYSKKNADTKGIVYTPQAIVKFMVKFTNSLISNEFSKNLSDKGVTIIDPCVGTGNFILEILKNLHPLQLSQKYEKEVFCNELMLLPYYIASVNIEYYYYKQTGKYKPFENIVFTDTLELIKEPEKPQQSLFSFNEVNTKRAQNQLDTDFVVVIGNPPYNLKQSRDFGNKNSNHEIVDKLIAETYVKSSTATLKQINYDPCIKFIRWATNRLDNENGIVCFITNNVFMHSTASDGIRRNLMRDFNRIYHIDLGGDMRVNRKEVKGNVFGITVGVGISFFVKNKKYKDNKIFYLNLRDENFLKEDYFNILDNLRETKNDFNEFNWIEGNLENGIFVFSEASRNKSVKYNSFIPLFNKEGACVFHSKTPGVKTDRDEWVYNFSKEKLIEKIKLTINFYNSEVDRLQTYILNNKTKKEDLDIDNFVTYHSGNIKWSAGLKAQLLRFNKTEFSENKIVTSFFRPFVKKFLYYDKILIDRPSVFGELMKYNNIFICINGLGAQKQFSCLATNDFTDSNITPPGQIFPLFYMKNNQQEFNITPYILNKIQTETNNKKITKEQIFYYVYGILHHENFRTEFAEQLKINEPKIPIITDKFVEIAEIGFELAKIHSDFENANEYNLKTFENFEVEKHFNIEKLTISKKDGSFIYNNYFSFHLPENIHDYKICGRSPIQWICDQFSNLEFDGDGFIRTIKKVTTVSILSINLIKQLNNIEIP